MKEQQEAEKEEQSMKKHGFGLIKSLCEHKTI